jgi:predicted Zn-dependent peptidase
MNLRPRTSISIFLLLAAILTAPGVARGQDRPASDMPDGRDLPVVEHVLPNGMRFLILPRGGAPTVSFVVHVPVGSVHESSGATGLAHFLEHLLFKGSTTVGTRDIDAERALFAQMDAAHDTLVAARGGFPTPDSTRIQALEERIRVLEDSARTFVVPNAFDEILSRNGAQGLNATTSYESTEYFVELPANRARLWFVLEADRMRNPVFREFYREREVIEEERRARMESDPGGRLYEAHMGAAFRVHPYGVAPIGHASDIRNLGRREVESFYRTHYGPENTVVAVVGAIDADSVKAWADAYFAPLERRGSIPPVRSVEPQQRGERRVEVWGDAEPQLRIGWKVERDIDPDAPARALLANLLVGGRDARLYRRLVREERVASSVSAGGGPGARFPGLFVLHATPRAPHTPEEVESIIYDELRRFEDTPPTPLELERVRTRLEAARVRRLNSNLGLAFQLVGSAALYGDWKTTFELQARLQQVTAEDVVRVVRDVLRPEVRTVAVFRRMDIDRAEAP